MKLVFVNVIINKLIISFESNIFNTSRLIVCITYIFNIQNDLSKMYIYNFHQLICKYFINIYYLIIFLQSNFN